MGGEVYDGSSLYGAKTLLEVSRVWEESELDVDEPSRTAACLEMLPLDESPAEGNGERGGAEDEAEGLGRKLGIPSASPPNIPLIRSY